jgi:hypothetical protein
MARVKPRINPVAKFAQQLQRCKTFVDKKKRIKSGYTRHKKADGFFCPPFLSPQAGHESVGPSLF